MIYNCFIYSDMKELRKTKNDYFICEECNKTYRTLSALTTHIRHSHNKQYKEYFDKWIRENNDGLCKICGKEAIFSNIDYGYRSGCCKDHMNKWNQIQIKKAVQNKYGVDNIFQCEEIKDKMKETYNKKYGVDYNHQNIGIMKKSLQTGFKIKQFRNTDIWFQGSYELDFLEKFYDKYSDIQQGPSINYVFKNKNRVYHSDFFIPSLNLIVEIKSTYYNNMHKEIIDTKEKSTISNGFNYCMILDKKYDKLPF